MRRFHRIVLSFFVVLILGVTGFVLWFFVFSREVPQDLSPLAEFAQKENYSALIRRVQERPLGSEGFKFVVMGDSRSNLAVAREVFKQAVSEGPAFILSTGDIVRRGRVEEYVSYHIPLVESVAPIPVIVAAGNHEEGPNKDFAAFEAIYGGDRFSFDYGGGRFVGVNNGDWGGMSGDDLSYLERELSKPGATHKFVVFHVPPRFIPVHGDDGRGFRWNAGRFHALMKRQNVEQVFMGHVHGFHTMLRDGIRYTITAGGGAPLDQRLGPEGAVHNLVVVQVTPSGIRNEVVRLENSAWKRQVINAEVGMPNAK
ncbi:MAG: metallophosphoesterase [Candidatus Hydrogenedentes bacterium]|nr:metallophosphoesterase [Candidatus Hydrogenedentota bacterium]